MQFRVLGSLEVLDGAGPVVVRRGRPRSLLHLLLLHRRVVLPVDVIAERLWPAEQPADAGNAVHQLVSYLRRALGEGGRSALVTGPTGYMLDVRDDDIDATVFLTHVQSALDSLESDKPSEALAATERGALLWRGEPYAESATYEWVSGDTQRLQDAYLLLQEARLDALLQLGRHREALLEASSLVSAYPLREQLHGQLSVALYRGGRQGEALEVHRNLRSLLADELGIDPSAALQELESRILRQDPTLDRRPGTPSAPSSVPTRPQPDDRTSVPDLPPPSYAAPLRGRETELSALGSLAQAHRLVTLVGPPGVGKSRLAAAHAQRSTDEHRWYVDLSEVAAATVTASTIAGRLCLDAQGDDPGERLAEALDVSGLLVLDGCEVASDSVRELVSDLLGRTERLRILAVSRRPLQVAGEVVSRLGPLEDSSSDGTSPAAQVFLDSAAATTGRLIDDPAELVQVADIVRALDGLPLAIELAAANLDVLGLSSLQTHVAAQLDYLVQPGRDAPARHQSLRAAIRGSIDLLSPEERHFLAQLAVFPGTFDLEAAAAITAATPAVAYQRVASLVRQSLLVTDGRDGYRLLSPIRDYAGLMGDELETDVDEVRTRHSHYIATLVAPVAGDLQRQPQKDSVRQLRHHLSDARAALQWSLRRGDVATAAQIASAYAWFWNLLGMTHEGITHLLEVRTLADASEDGWRSSPTYATLLRNIGLLANPVGRLALAEETCSEAAVLCTRLEDWDGAARALLTKGIALWARGAYAEAATAHEEAAALHQRGASDWSHVSATALRARTALDAGEPDVESRIDAAVTAARQADDKHMSGLAALVQARWAQQTGRTELAGMAAERALEVWRAISYLEGEIGALNLSGRLALDSSRRDDADRMFHEALEVSVAAGHPGGQCESVESMALAALAGCRYEHAYFLSSVAALERHRIGATVPAADRPRLQALRDTCTGVLGPAADLVRARAEAVGFVDVRRDLLAP